jgi:hypothetical protein
MRFEMVIARYQEDISWSDRYKECRKIYNKGDEIEEQSVALPDIGREAYTYIYHVVNNYNDLADYTAFVQGHPFDHVPYFHQIIEKFLNSESPEDFVWLSSWLIYSGLGGLKDHHLGNKYSQEFDENFYKFFQDEPARQDFEFGAGAEFIVSKKSIQSRPLEFYQNALAFFEEENEIDGLLPYQIERYWRVFFDYDYSKNNTI